MGIRKKTIWVLGLFGLAAIAIIGFVSYRMNMKNVMAEANIKSNIVLNYAMSSLKYMKFVQKPLVLDLVEKDRFYPELMSGFVTARGTYEYFNESFPGYIFKQATLDPLNPSNRADEAERNIIEAFKLDPELQDKQGTLVRGVEEVYYIAQPIKVDQEKCLKCHGDPAKAPKDQQERYGTATGYNWKKGDTVAAFIVYVPIKTALKTARTNSIGIVIVSGLGVLIMLIAIGIMLDRSVVAPVISLTRVTEALSLGKELDSPIEYGGSNEIHTLAESIDRLRKSLVIMFKRLSKRR